MKGIFKFAVAASLCLSSCGLYEIGGGKETVRGDVWGGPLAGDIAPGPSNSLSCVTVLDYKKGYDWRSDQARENVKCSLVVYVEGVPIMKIPVGDIYEAGTDPDMHRLIDGHIYSDYATDSETVIRKDGQVLLRYLGSESLRGMSVMNDDVYTLGQNRSGEGFSFRRNAEVVFARQHGEIIGGLQNDSDSLCFSYCESIISEGAQLKRYYMVIDGELSQVAVREDIRRVWDIGIRDGKIVYVASLVGTPLPVLFSGDIMTALSLPAGAEMVSCRLFDAGERLAAEGIYRFSNGACYNAVWLDGKPLVTFGKDEVISAIGVYDDGVFCAVNPADRRDSGTIYRCGDVYEMPPGYVVMGDSCMAMINGILHVGLSSTTGERPLVWKDALMDTLQVNGYISGVYPLSLQENQSSQHTERD